MDYLYGVLSGLAIQQAVEEKEITIEPFNPKQLNPASYDVTLGDRMTCYKRGAFSELDPKVVNPYEEHTIPKSGFVVRPGEGYLLHTRERIHTWCYVPVLDGKSSLGRLFLMIHCTAGYGDPGFEGQYTLEVVSLVHPVILYPGMRIGQVRFHTLVGQVEQYQGHYRGDSATGAVYSHAYEQFEGK